MTATWQSATETVVTYAPGAGGRWDVTVATPGAVATVTLAGIERADLDAVLAWYRRRGATVEGETHEENEP